MPRATTQVSAASAGLAQRIFWLAARQTAVRSGRCSPIAAPVTKRFDGVNRWQAMGIAWSGQAGRSRCVTFRGAQRGGRAVARAVLGELRDTALAEEAPGAGLRASGGTQVGRALDETGRAARVVWRRGWRSRGVLGHRGVGAGLESLHAEHEPSTAGWALAQ